MGKVFDVSVFFSVILVIREYEPKDWFADVIKPMGDVVDAILADRTLGKKVKDCYPVGFAPGEIKFEKDKVLYGGIVRFQGSALVWPSEFTGNLALWQVTTHKMEEINKK